MAKNKSSSPIPEAQENPDWLLRGPEGGPLAPPVKTRSTELPFTQLGWRDFERLCRRLAGREGNVEQVLAYGKSGQAQYGIDILVRLSDGNYEVWQSKRYKKFKPSNVKDATDLFLKHRWANKAQKFVLAVACNLDDTHVVEAIEEARERLQAKKIAFEPIGGSALSERLIAEPEIVDDYFGRAWAETMCPEEAQEILASRLSRFGLEELRRDLKRWYMFWISTVDPGLPVADLGRSGRAAAAIPIEKRYVRPNILLPITEPEFSIPSTETGTPNSPASDSSHNAADEMKREASERRPLARTSAPPVREQRVELDHFLSSEARAIIAADAGMGKSTLLRIIALDLLAEEPQFAVARDRYAKFLPVWIPFAMWTRMASGRAAPPSIDELIRAFFVAQNEPTLAEEVGKALASGKVLLLVDGLDEASDMTSAETVASVLATYVESHEVPVLVTSRPHGLQAMGRFAGTWSRVKLAPLSDAQRQALAMLWFQVIVELESEGPSGQDIVEAEAARRAKRLISALTRNPGIARLSQTPLFLLALLQLHRHGQEMPRSRFAAIEKVIEQLVEHQPRRRAIETLLTSSSTEKRQRLRDRVLDDFAFALHAGDLKGPVSEAAAENDAVARAAIIVMRRQGDKDQDAAEEVARSVFVFAEERAGLLVKKASQAIGFLHLSIQEFLAARHLMQRPFAERVAFVTEHAEQSRWREPILYLLYMEKNEVQVGELVQAIEGGRTTSVYGRQVRNTLLFDAVFADFAHDIAVARGIANRLLDEAELTEWGEQRQRVITSAVDGLSSETVSELCRVRIERWLPNRHGYRRSAALNKMAHWPAAMHRACRAVLMRSLSADEYSTREAAAKVLPIIATADGETKQEIKALIEKSPSIETLAASLRALGCGWADDSDVGELAETARASSEPSISLEAIWIRACRKETDDQDFERFLELTYSERSIGGEMKNRRLIEHFAEERRPDYVARLEAMIDQKHDRNPHDLMPLIGSLILCDPQHPSVVPGVHDLISHGWMMRDVFSNGEFPVERVPWTQGLVEDVRHFAKSEDKRFYGYELYWISKVLPEPWLKDRTLINLQNENFYEFWSARSLVEVWGADDAEVQQAFVEILRKGGNAAASVAELLPAVINDEDECRDAFLRILKDKPQRAGAVVAGFRELGVAPEDDEAFKACLEAGTNITGGEFFHDVWRTQMILTFPSHPEVRDIALNELSARNGAVGAIASSYTNDDDMMAALLRVLTPLPESSRLVLVSALQEAAMADDRAMWLLKECKEDTDGSVAAEGVFGWMEALAARGTIAASDVDELAEALHTVGLDYDERRAAAVVALAIADRLDRFAEATERPGEPLKLDVTRSSFRNDTRYLRRILRFWPKFIEALGSEDAVIKRLGIKAETTLPLLNPNDPNAECVFKILTQRMPVSRHLDKHVEIGAWARFAPRSEEMRSLVLAQFMGRDNSDYWGGLVAGEVFAEHFSDDVELRAQILTDLDRFPAGFAGAALAELLLRKPDSEIELLLREKASEVSHDVVSYYKLVAALSGPEKVADILTGLLANIPMEVYTLHLSRWVPTMVRRIERDAELRDALTERLTVETPPSQKVSFTALLGKGSGANDKLQAYASAEVERLERSIVPDVGFDITSQSYRLVRQVLIEALV